MAEILAVWGSLQAGVPILLVHLGVTLALWLIGWRLMLLLIPSQAGAEKASDNAAIGVLRGAEGLALAMPLAACLAGSINATDVLMWGAVVVVLQFAFSLVSRWWVSDFAARVTGGQVGLAVSMALARCGFAVINAAAVSA